MDDVAELPGHIINTESSSLWFARQTALCLTSVVLRGAGSAVLTGAFALATPEYSHLIGPMVSDFVVNTAMLAFVAPWADQ